MSKNKILSKPTRVADINSDTNLYEYYDDIRDDWLKEKARKLQARRWRRIMRHQYS